MNVISLLLFNNGIDSQNWASENPITIDKRIEWISDADNGIAKFFSISIPECEWDVSYSIVVVLGAVAGVGGDVGEDDLALAAPRTAVTGVTGTLWNTHGTSARSDREYSVVGILDFCVDS